jgi:uncharacterized repeat protein (TIGR01451 family)
MRPIRLLTTLAGPLAVAGALAAAGPALAASSRTIGDTTLPAGATMPTSSCTTNQQTELVPYSTDPAYNYAVPSGGGSITSWSFNTSGAKPGTPYSLVVVRPQGPTYGIVGTDTETVPATGRLATFTLATPIAVQGGDLIGAMVQGKSSVGCLFKGGTIPTTDVEGFSLSPDTVGSSFNLTKTIPNELVNVSATVVQSNDIGITQTAEPSAIMQGDDGVFVLNVTSSGPSSTPVTVTDTLPSALTPVSASAGTGSCTTSGQTVTCQVSGAPASIAIVAAGAEGGSFTNTATASGPLLDPNPANNTSTSALQVNTMSGVGTQTTAAPGGLADLNTPTLALGRGSATGLPAIPV